MQNMCIHVARGHKIPIMQQHLFLLPCPCRNLHNDLPPPCRRELLGHSFAQNKTTTPKDRPTIACLRLSREPTLQANNSKPKPKAFLWKGKVIVLRT